MVGRPLLIAVLASSTVASEICAEEDEFHIYPKSRPIVMIGAISLIVTGAGLRQLPVGALGPSTVDVAAPPPGEGLRAQLALKLREAPHLHAVRAHVRLDVGSQLAHGGQVNTEQLRPPFQRRRLRTSSVRGAWGTFTRQKSQVRNLSRPPAQTASARGRFPSPASKLPGFAAGSRQDAASPPAATRAPAAARRRSLGSDEQTAYIVQPLLEFSWPWTRRPEDPAVRRDRTRAAQPDPGHPRGPFAPQVDPPD
jgi:hypothetical protein